MITGVVTAFFVGVLVEMIVGPGTAFGGAKAGMITGPETAFGGAISGEKILPLQVILLVPVILLMPELTFSELESSAGVSVGMITTSSIGVLLEIIIGLRTIFGVQGFFLLHSCPHK